MRDRLGSRCVGRGEPQQGKGGGWEEGGEIREDGEKRREKQRRDRRKRRKEGMKEKIEGKEERKGIRMIDGRREGQTWRKRESVGRVIRERRN